MKEVKVILIIGPTASGKTDLSIKLAQTFNGECLNADATQMFNGLDIATNKITLEEQQGVKHHFLSFLDLTANYSISDFQKAGRATINEIVARNKLPIVVGGSGLYINALLKNYQFSSQGRNLANLTKYEHYSNQALWEMLAVVDKEESKKVHYNNRKRILRALEYYDQNQIPKSVNDHDQNIWYIKPYIIGLLPDKDELHTRIAERVLALTARGLFAEVAQAYQQCHQSLEYQSMHIIGCREIVSFLKEDISEQDAIMAMIKANKIYAKKQITWFKHQLSDVNWYQFSYSNFDAVSQKIIEDLKESDYLREN
ncbi:tRNA (adenosine(37)-N6)-dimethylallyltransferase MiaA [Spiroplasma chrysopicola]|uniref:tRNA dimethylallyltransferase n=1 Tax=Spiroplasma chrysopicola DF-1 TaxID=1276227 RepID=R4UGB1_9MOLU|nr:tRNA (adenosine(37)-N6)-dimethylallyltransferase MiaA [Spiroplasma chrysopicola]AGM25140.1 tRNA delta(2)-isopentenylpyrophosphate transferase [Spiroplasma chrysopicola DF-1]